MNKRIINLCLSGMVPTKELNQNVPVTPEEMIRDALLCAELGASIIHIHPRDKYGKPTWEKAIFEKIIYGIKEKNKEVLISVTTSGRLWNEFEKRSACLEIKGDLKPDLASLTIGSMNFINTNATNHPEMIEKLVQRMQENGIKPEMEIFEPGMIHKAKYLLKKRIIKDEKPYFNLLLGSLGTTPLEPVSFGAMHSLLPENAVWSVAGIGKYQLDANIIGLGFGGNIRVGLEDNIYLDKEKKEPASNEKLLKRIVKIMAEMGLEPAIPKEARESLGIK